MSKVSRKKAYAEYLQGKRWEKFREEALEYYGNQCGRCGSMFNLHVHHLTYKNRFKETFKDVMLLCKSCHYVVHKKHRKPKKIDRDTVTYYLDKRS